MQEEWRKANAERRRAAVNAQNRAWREANPDRVNQYRDNKRAAKFSLTKEELSKLTSATECAVCGSEEPGGRWDSFHIDHDHSCCPGSTSCGMCIRSPLCMACNILIGHMEKAGPGVVALAAQYLLRSKAEVLEDLPAS